MGDEDEDAHYMYNYSVEADVRVSRPARSLHDPQLPPDPPTVAALRSLIGSVLDTFGREHGSELVRAVVREMLGEEPAPPTPADPG